MERRSELGVLPNVESVRADCDDPWACSSWTVLEGPPRFFFGAGENVVSLLIEMASEAPCVFSARSLVALALPESDNDACGGASSACSRPLPVSSSFSIFFHRRLHYGTCRFNNMVASLSVAFPSYLLWSSCPNMTRDFVPVCHAKFLEGLPQLEILL